MSKLQWLLAAAATVTAFILAAPQLRESYIGYFLAGKCSETDGPSIPQCRLGGESFP